MQLHKIFQDIDENGVTNKDIYWIDTDSLFKTDGKYMFKVYKSDRNGNDLIDYFVNRTVHEIVNTDAYYKNTQEFIKSKFAEYLV